MNIIAKRVTALLIDALLFGIFYTIIIHFFPSYFWNLGSISYVIVFIPFLFKDCVFKNSSIGKKILGIQIYDANWKTLNVILMLKRTVCMQTVGYIIFIKIKFLGKRSDIMTFFDWERERLKTIVIDKKVFDRLNQEADRLPGNHVENLTKLYNNFLRKNYAE